MDILLLKNMKARKLLFLCDPQKIKQAFIAFLMNAIEAMHFPGKVTIKVYRENHFAIVRIKDEGTGISAKDIPHIFEPFFSTKEAAQGTGLGLAVTYGIITGHSGRISVEETSPNGNNI